MKYLSIGIVAIVIILVFYNQFGKKNENKEISRNINRIETKDNKLEQEKLNLGKLKKINSKEYHRFILTKNTTESYLTKGIKDYGELSGNEEYKIYNFGISQHGDWHIIRVEESISFYAYHNLAAWLTGYEENTKIPELSIGFSKNTTNSQEDYLFFLDPENEQGHTQIGTFRDGKSFSIYLPEAYEEYGNLTIKNEIQVSMKENTDYIAKQGFNILDIDSLKYTEHKIKMNE